MCFFIIQCLTDEFCGGLVLLGYVRAYKPDMKMKDYELYRGIYCSLCRALGRNYTPVAQLFLSYDFALACVIRLACAESGCGFSPVFFASRQQKAAAAFRKNAVRITLQKNV